MPSDSSNWAVDVGRAPPFVGLMSTTKQETRQTARRLQDSPWPQVRRSETDQLEAFTDCVLSITITPLVAEIVRPEYAPGQLLERLAEQSASYIAFLASFAMPVLFGSIIVRCSQGCATATAVFTWLTFFFC